MESILQLLVKDQIDINPLIGRTVEGSDRRGGISAAGVYPLIEEDQLRFSVLPARLLEEVRPDDLGIAENRGYEILGFLVGRRGRRPALCGRGLLILLLEEIEDLSWIGAQESRDQHDNQRSDSTDGDSSRLDSPSILDVLAPGFVLPTHRCLTWAEGIIGVLLSSRA